MLPDSVPFPRLVDYGRGIGIWAAWAFGFGSMAFAMFRLRNEPVPLIAIAQVVAGFAFAFAHAMPSIDVYAYLAYADQLLHGINPWLSAPTAINDDIASAFRTVWGNTGPSCRYGPGFVVFEAALLRSLAGYPLGVLVIAQRFVSLAASVGITVLLRGPNARYWALNPFVSYYYVLEAHNDVLFLVALAAAARARQPFAQGLAVGIAGSVKIVALLALARSKSRRTVGVTAGALSLLVVLYIIVPLALDGDGLRAQVGSVGNSFASLAVSVEVALLSSHASVIVVEVGVLLAALIAAAFIRWSKRDAATFVALLFIAALPVFWPWYLGWALFASVASSSRATMRFVAALCVCSFVTELPYVDGFVYNVQVTWLFLLVWLLLLCFYGIIPGRFAKPGDAGTLYWHARRLLTLRNSHAL